MTAKKMKALTMMRPQSHGGRRSSRDIIRLDCNEILSHSNFARFLASGNRTAVVTLFLCSVAISGRIALIEELDNPLSGLIHIPPEAMRKALAEIAR